MTAKPPGNAAAERELERAQRPRRNRKHVLSMKRRVAQERLVIRPHEPIDIRPAIVGIPRRNRLGQYRGRIELTTPSVVIDNMEAMGAWARLKPIGRHPCLSDQNPTIRTLHTRILRHNRHLEAAPLHQPRVDNKHRNRAHQLSPCASPRSQCLLFPRATSRPPPSRDQITRQLWRNLCSPQPQKSKRDPLQRSLRWSGREPTITSVSRWGDVGS